MENINVNKVYNLNEDIKYPICHLCKIKLTPFSITQENWQAITIETKQLILQLNIITMNKLDKGLHLIFLCVHCLKWEIEKC